MRVRYYKNTITERGYAPFYKISDNNYYRLVKNKWVKSQNNVKVIWRIIRNNNFIEVEESDIFLEML